MSSLNTELLSRQLEERFVISASCSGFFSFEDLSSIKGFFLPATFTSQIQIENGSSVIPPDLLIGLQPRVSDPWATWVNPDDDILQPWNGPPSPYYSAWIHALHEFFKDTNDLVKFARLDAASIFAHQTIIRDLFSLSTTASIPMNLSTYTAYSPELMAEPEELERRGDPETYARIASYQLEHIERKFRSSPNQTVPLLRPTRWLSTFTRTYKRVYILSQRWPASAFCVQSIGKCVRFFASLTRIR